jgi:hypothetical protein
MNLDMSSVFSLKHLALQTIDRFAHVAFLRPVSQNSNSAQIVPSAFNLQYASDLFTTSTSGDLEEHFAQVIIDCGDSSPTIILGRDPPSAALPKPLPSVPARVESHVPLVVQASSIKSQGNGVFVREAVKAGDIVFKVKKPVMSIVGFQNSVRNGTGLTIGQITDDEHSLLNTCDHCFTLKALSISSKHSPYSTTDEDFNADRQPNFSCADHAESTATAARYVRSTLLSQRN